MLVFKIIFSKVTFLFVTEDKIRSFIENDNKLPLKFAKIVSVFSKVLIVFIVIEELWGKW